MAETEELSTASPAASATTPSPQPAVPQFVSVKVLYQAVLFVSLAMSALSLVVYDRFFAIKIASFDMPGFLTQVRTARLENRITEEQANKLWDEAKRQVDVLPPNYLVLSGDIIFGNAKRVKKLTMEVR